MKLNRKIILTISLLSFCLPGFALPNPAAVNCQDKNLYYVMIEETGICIFKDNSYCEEWAYFRGQCKQGDNAFPEGKFDKSNPNKYCIQQDNEHPTQVIICEEGS